MCRSRRELSNEYVLAKIGVDTAENEPCKVCPLSVYRSPRFLSWYAMWFCIVSNWSFIQSKAHKQLAAAWLFVYGVLMISMEDWLRLDKSIIAVVMAAVLWTVRAYDIGETENKLLDDLVEQLGEMAEVVFFLLSAMSIVETIELHEGFFWVEQWLPSLKGSIPNLFLIFQPN